MKSFYPGVCCIFFCLFISGYISAQTPLKIGQWQQHLPFTRALHVTQSENKVYFSSDYAILVLDKANYEESPEFLTRVEGLSNTSPGIIGFNKATETLIVTYLDASFDLVDATGIRTFNNIRDDATFFDRSITGIRMIKDSLAFFTTAFGLVEFNVAAQEFGVTVDFEKPVFDVALFDGYFYVATEDGILRALDDPRVNLKDLANWNLLSANEGFPSTYTSNTLFIYNGKMYLGLDDNLMVWENGTLRLIYEATNNRSLQFLTADGDHLLAGFYCAENDCAGEIVILDQDENISKDVQSCVSRLQFAVEDQNGRIWHADRWRGFRLSNPNDGSCEVLSYKTPSEALISDIEINNNIVYVTSSLQLQTVGTAILKDGEWDIYSSGTRPELSGANAWGHYKVTTHPETGNAFIATFFRGLVEIDQEDNITVYTDDFQVSDDPNAYRIGGLAFDDNNNLWMSNHTASNPLIVRLADGTFKNDFNIPSGQPLHHLAIDRNGYKWVSIDNNGLIVYDEGNIDDASDDRRRFFTAGNSELPSNNVLSIEKDLDGDIWVGTEDGAAVFDCDPFDDRCIGRKPIVTVAGIPELLLKGESVRSIMVDGANRKWFGTLNGIFVQSPDGRTQIENINIENAPLFGNTIFAMAFNPENGEVFIGTDQGLLSVRSESTEGGIVNSNNIYAFPNPVRPEYSGPIAIKGLVRDANVKITDVNGQLVFETTALGGQAIWDGRNFDGRKVSSGVYLVYSTNTRNRQSTDAVVTKILLLN